MHDMFAEFISAEDRDGLLWHVAGHDGNALCDPRLHTRASAPHGARAPDSYCHRCMHIMAEAMAAANPGTDRPAAQEGARTVPSGPGAGRHAS